MAAVKKNKPENNDISGEVPKLDSASQAQEDTTITRSAESYDRMPYTSNPFPQTQPTRIGAIARLFGLNPPAVATARVLEIGCASGGNLMPMAARFPNARFTGIDISPVQVAEGEARRKALGLDNIEILCRSITDFEAPAESFDYIICHGVFSWVDAAVREAILACVGKMLSRDGVADVSYNVLPGWRMRQALRDSMILHAGAGEDTAHRVTRARWMLNFLKERTATTTPWGQMFRNEAELLSRLPDDYVAHEFLEDVNEPMTFTAFAEQARTYGLAYLGDADIATMIPENLDATTAVMLREMCGGQVLPIEQYMDIVTARTFRQSLLVRADNAASISRNLDIARMDGLHLLPNRDIRITPQADGGVVYVDSVGRNLRTVHPGVARALDAMLNQLPGSTMLADLLPENVEPETRALVCDALTKMLQVGLLHLSSEPVPRGSVISEKPMAAAMSRLDAAAGRIVVNPRHEAITLGLVARTIMPALDGTRDRAALREVILKAVAEGQIIFQREGVQITTADGVAQEASNHLETVLRDLAFCGLLTG